MVKVLPLFCPFSVCESVIYDFLLACAAAVHPQWPRAVAELAVVGVTIGISVVVCDSHVVQTVVLWRGWCGVWKAIGLVGEPVGGAEALSRAYSAGPLVGVLRMKGLPLKAVLFGSVRCSSLAILVDVHQEFRRVDRRRGACVQQELLMLG